ncbi:hypothetical protein F416_gp035 [Salmonella typhimurium phage PhiSH19]|uniref:Uncharacterized protein n=1 Tax=Salmonella typhimurium phage PhiSH19 TaxID=1108865 RepID=G8GDG1_9CAUD|nr:hypothetical protein F416_gp035 [Salmonella phage Sh19]AER70167.1 putative uncharacterized protein [Salmonella phage Sh19]
MSFIIGPTAIVSYQNLFGVLFWRWFLFTDKGRQKSFNVSFAQRRDHVVGKNPPSYAKIGIAFRNAILFIKEKGLVTEFNQFCSERRRLQRQKSKEKLHDN